MRTADKYYFADPADLGEGQFVWQAGKGRWVRLQGPPTREAGSRFWRFQATDTSGLGISFSMAGDSVRTCQDGYVPPAWRPEAIYARATGLRRQAETLGATADRMFALAHAMSARSGRGIRS